jgi:hypothetical protein
MAFLKYRGSTITPGTWTANAFANAPLTNLDIDKNFASLDAQKLDLIGGTISGGLSIGSNLTADLKDDQVYFVDGADTSKKLAFQLSGIAASTTRTLTIPNASGTIALTSDFGNITLATVTANGASTTSAISIANATDSTSTTSGALTVSGGVGISNNLYVGGNLVVNGTTTTINSTIVSYDDPILTLGGDTSSLETAKDRGIEFKWAGTALTITNYIGNNTTTVTATVGSTTGFAAGDIITISGAVGTQQVKLNGTWTIATVPNATTFTFIVTSAPTAGTLTAGLGLCIKSKNGFFGLDQSTGYFSFRPQSLNTSEAFSGTLGDIEATTFRGGLVGGSISGTTGSFTNAVTLPSIAATAATTLLINGASSSTTGGIAYAVTITGGAGGDTTAAGFGGAVNIVGGRSGNNANSGAAVYGGAVNITGGAGNTLFAQSAPGGVTIAGGTAVVAGQAGANVSVLASSGFSSATASNGGNLTLAAGAGGGTGSNGYVSISAPGQAGGTAPYISFTTGIVERFKIQNTVSTFSTNLSVTGEVSATTFDSLSDVNFKKDLEVITGALDKVTQLTGYTYTLIESDKRSAGLTAQQVEEVLPEAVTDGDRKTLNYNAVMGLIVEAIKELNDKVTDLQNQIENK